MASEEPLSGPIRAAVDRAFPRTDDRARVVRALERVSDDGGAERVRTAILVCGTFPEPDVARVEKYARIAAVDFRDVLVSAEYNPKVIDYEAAVRALGLESQKEYD